MRRNSVKRIVIVALALAVTIGGRAVSARASTDSACQAGYV